MFFGQHLFLVLWVSFLPYLYSVDFHDFDGYQGKLTEQEVELKINKFLEKDSAIRKFYRLTPQALYIGEGDHEQIDYVLKLKPASTTVPTEHPVKKSLKNAKIAIDPGHFGGKWAELEERYIAVPAEKTKNHQSIRLQEGDLTYLTAIELQRLLELEGAVVLLTRPGIGCGAIAEDFFEWREKHKKLGDRLSLSQVFRLYYNSEDLIERAKKINEFSPDVTVIIHYNVHITDPENILTPSNYSLAFIPGAFCRDELKTEEDRYEFFRLILTNEIDESLKLSQQITKQFVRQLGVPLIPKNAKSSWIDSSCLIQSPGIYCRNLALTRRIHSPLCYGETLIQNNRDEVYRLSEQEASNGERPCPQRVKEVARAYFEGIRQYFQAG